MKKLVKDSILSQQVKDYVESVVEYAEESSYDEIDPTDLAVILAGDLEEQGLVEQSNEIINAIRDFIILELEETNNGTNLEN